MDAGTWTDMFTLGLPVLEKVARPIIVYVFLIVGLRVAGKRELAQLNPFDLVVLLTLSNTVQNAIIGEDSSVTGGIIGAATLLIVNAVFVRFAFSHPELERLAEGEPTVLIESGRIDEEALRREQVTRPELEAAAHRQGFTSLAEVERCVLEPAGTVSFIGKKPSPEAVRHDELMGRLAEMSREMAAIRAAMGARP